MPEEQQNSQVNWGDFAGQTIIGKGIDTSFGLFGNFIGNKWAQEREEEARRQNYEYGEKSAQNADARYRALIEEYGTPSAKLRMLQEAGLSPSLFFGEGANAPQPSSGAQGTGAGGISPTSFGSLSTEAYGNTMLNLAKAREANAEADRIEGKGERGKNEIEKLAGEIAYQYLINETTEWENTRKALEINLLSTYGEEELNNKIREYSEKANLLHEQVREQKVKGNITEKTEDKIIKTIDADFRKKLAEISSINIEKELKEKQIDLTQHQINNLVQKTADDHHAVMLKDEQTYYNQIYGNQQLQLELKKIGIEDEKLRWKIANILFNGIMSTGSKFNIH